MTRVLMCLLIFGLGARGALHAAPGDPVGGEFQVNTYTTAAQFPTAVLPRGTDGFVVVWHGRSGTDPDYGVLAQRVDASGALVGGEVQVNTFTTGPQGEAAVAPTGASGFVVVWESGGSSGADTSERGILGQRYDDAGTPVGGEFQVNSYTTGTQHAPSAASNADGFVAVWVSEGSSGTDTSEFSIQARRFDGAGAPLGNEFQVNSFTTGTQDRAAVAPMGTGGFVVVWRGDYSSGTDDSGESVQTRVFDAAGTPVGDDFQVNTYTTSSQGFARAFPSSDGFWVVWQSDGGASDGDGSSIQARRFDATGTPLGDQLQVNTYTTAGQSGPAITMDAGGDFVVVWESGGSGSTDTSQGSIQARRYDAVGSPLGDQFQVNAYTTGNQYFTEVGPDGAGGFVVVWSGDGDGTDTDVGVRAQRFEAAPKTTTTTTLPFTVQALEGRTLSLKTKPGRPQKSKLKLQSRDRDLTLGRGNLSVDDPVVHGGELRISSSAGGFAATHGLVGSWRYVSKVGRNRGYKWESRSGAIRAIQVKKRKLSIEGVGADVGFDLNDDPGPVRVELTIGALTYCLEFGGETPDFKAGRFYRAKRSAAPAGCP